MSKEDLQKKEKISRLIYYFKKNGFGLGVKYKLGQKKGLKKSLKDVSLITCYNCNTKSIRPGPVLTQKTSNSFDNFRINDY